MKTSKRVRVVHAVSFAALLLLIVAVAATLEPAGAGARPKDGGKSGGAGKARPAIASPKPGQKVKSSSPRLIVRAGAETGDLRAKLNGKAIGKRFAVNLKRHRRYLDASLVDGLRRGKNNLVVWVKGKSGRYRKSKVTFYVTNEKPLASAGTDVRLPVGSKIELHGQLLMPEAADGAAHASDTGEASAAEVEWSIVNAPPESELSLPLATIEPAEGGPAGIEEANSLSPVFVPDVSGTYELQMIARGPTGIGVDWVTVYVIPSTPLVILNTEANGGAGGKQPAIRIGSNVLAAPYMRTVGGTENYSGTTPEGKQYKALWQVVSLDRTTLELKWNRTYGLCRSGSSGNWSTCVVAETDPASHVPAAANLNEELTKASNEELIVATSHGGSEWASPTEGGFVESNFAPIGFPKESDPEIGAAIKAAKPGELAGVGIPGLKQGEATIAAATGKPGMTGYLSPGSDLKRHYGYMSSQRVPFDTRASYNCASGTCTVAQRIGKGSSAVEVKGSVPAEKGGFLIAGYNRLTLQPIESRTFVTAFPGEEQEGNFGPPRKALEEIPGYLAGLASKQAIVLITSIHGNQQQRKILYQQGTPAWGEVLGEVAKLGGAREDLIAGMSTPGADYSLVGQAKQPEGSSAGSSSPEARLRGFLVPDNDSIYRPEAVNPKGKPSELLMEEVLRAPGSQAWPGENEPEVMKAMAWIGKKTVLGERPRFSYWERLKTATEAGEALKEVERVTPQEGQGFTPAAYSTAKKYLETELPMVQKARSYMELLASPAGGGKQAWGTAFQLSAELTDLQKKLEAEAKANASIGQFLSQMLQLIFEATGQVELAGPLKFAEDVATTGALGNEIYNTLYDGREGKPSQQVKAIDLANELEKQAIANEESFQRFGDILVSDWSKLQVVGTYGKCNAEGGCGPKGEYAELAYDPAWADEAKQATKEGAQRELYTQLVPLVFPIWKTEPLTRITDTNLSYDYKCTDLFRPFNGAPQLSYVKTPWNFTPNEEEGLGQPVVYQVYLSVRRDGLTYGFASKKVLEAMFNPVNARNAKEDGLGMSQADFMREGEVVGKFIPSHYCHWL